MMMQLLTKLDFHPQMGIISRTLGKAATDLMFFFLLVAMITGMYGLLGTLIFGRYDDNFATVSTSSLTMFSSLAGLYSYPANDDPIAQLYYWSYMCIAYFVMLNALLAIIIDAYTIVTEEQHAGRDPLTHSAWCQVDPASTAAGPHAVTVDELQSVLEAYVGTAVDREELEGQGPPGVMGIGVFPRPTGSAARDEKMKEREVKFVERAAEKRTEFTEQLKESYETLGTAGKGVTVHTPPLYLAVAPDKTIGTVCLDFRILTLAILVHERGLRNAHEHLPPLGRHNAEVLAANMLARYGDDDSDDDVSAGLVRLLKAFPYLADYFARDKLLEDHAANCSMLAHCLNYLRGKASLDEFASGVAAPADA